MKLAKGLEYSSNSFLHSPRAPAVLSSHCPLTIFLAVPRANTKSSGLLNTAVLPITIIILQKKELDKVYSFKARGHVLQNTTVRTNIYSFF